MANATGSFWTEEHEADLVRLLSHGYSRGQIAAILGVTRNAVIGKANRLGLQADPRNVNDTHRVVDPISFGEKRIPPRNRQRAARIREKKPALVSMVSVITGGMINKRSPKRPHQREMTKNELREMLAAAVRNTASISEPGTLSA